MDYNYVRMCNAIKENDYENAQHYRNLYEDEKNTSKIIPVIDVVIIALLILSVLLGAYLLYSETKLAELNVNINKIEATPVPVIGEVQ